jgi:hypothetical protein
MNTKKQSIKPKVKSPLDMHSKEDMYSEEFEELVLKFFHDQLYRHLYRPGKGLIDLRKKEDSYKDYKFIFDYEKDLDHPDINSESKIDDTQSIVEQDSGSLIYVSPKLLDMENTKKEQEAIKKYLAGRNLAPFGESLLEKSVNTHWIVEKDPKLTYKFTEVISSKNRTNQIDLDKGIGLIIKSDSQDLHYRSWHNLLVGKPHKTPSDSTKHRLREELNPWITSKMKSEPYWFSDLYKVELESKNRKWSLPCFTLYISKSHFTPRENQRFLKFNRHLRRAQKSALKILNQEYVAELNIREKNPRLKYRTPQWKKALNSIKRALSRSIDGWRIDDTHPPVLFPPSVYQDEDILANGDFISGYITLKKEGKPNEPLVRYIVIIKNEDLINGCESRENFLSERYAALIHLMNHNKDENLSDDFDGLIEVFSQQDKRKDLWKRHLNLTEFHPNQRYNPISLLLEMGGDVFYEPILVNNEKAYSVFFKEMVGAGKSKKYK